MKRKGFTLIELLAVIIILGILLLVAIPSISRYIDDSRKEVYITTAKQLINGARVMVNSGKMDLYDMDATYYIPSKCVKTETANKSPYGDFDKAFVIVTYNNDSYDYYWISRDTEGIGIKKITNEKELKSSIIETGIKSDDIKTSQLVDGKLITVVLEDDCNSVQVIDPIYDRIEERNEDGILRQNRYSDSDVFGKNIRRELFESITTVDHTNVPSNAIDSWDASVQGNGSIRAWYLDEDNNGLYELYIGEKNDVYANENSSYLFAGFINVKTIDLTHFDATNVKDMNHFFHNDLKLETVIIPSNINTKNVENMSYMFYECEKLKNIDLRNLNTARVNNMRYMFAHCLELQSVDVSRFNTTNVTDMSYMFYKNQELEELNLRNFDTSNVTDMSYMFYDCNKLETNNSEFDTSRVTTMTSMFDRCFNIKEINLSKFNTSNVTKMDRMFNDCKSLQSIDVSHFDTSKVTTMANMFTNLRLVDTIDVSHFDTSNVKDFNHMFYFCENVNSIDVSHFNTSNATNFASMFEGLKKVTTIDISRFDTSKATTMTGMFRYLDSMESLDISHFNTSNVTSMADMFYHDIKLTHLNLANIDTSKIKSMSYMFAYMPIETLDISSFDTRNVTDMNAAFYSMGKLKTIVTGPNFNTSKVVNFGMTFQACPNLVFDFSKVDTTSAKYMYRAFGGLTVETLDLSNMETPNLIDTMGAFINVTSKVIRLDKMDFSKVEYHGGNPYRNDSNNIKMFQSIASDAVIYVKDAAAKEFVEARLAELGYHNTVLIA